MPGHEFGRLKLVCARCRTRHQVGQAVAQPEEGFLLGGVKAPRGESGGVQGRPEPVTGTGEMVAGGRRVKAGIDTAEEHLELGPDDIAQALAASRCQLAGARSAG